MTLKDKILSKKPLRATSSTMCPMRSKGCTICNSMGVVLKAPAAFLTAEVCQCVQECRICEGSTMIPHGKSLESCTPLHPKRLSHLIKGAQIPSRYASARLRQFQNFAGNGREMLNSIQSWVKHFKPEQSPGMVISGDVGVGKTYLLTAISLELCQKGISVKFVDFHRLLSMIREAYSARKSDEFIIGPLADCDVLVIDELGKGRGSDWEQEKLDQIVMARYNRAKPIVASTNYHLRGKSPDEKVVSFDENPNAFNPDSFGSLESRVGQRIYSRLEETCQLLELKGRNFRHTNPKSSQTISKNLPEFSL